MSSRLALAAALFLGATLLASGCARTHLYYETTQLRHDPLSTGKKPALRQALEGKLRGRELVWVDPSGKERTLRPDAAGLAPLGIPELGALWLATAGGQVGGEHDLRVRTATRKSAPVSVLIDLEGNIRLLSPRRGSGPEGIPVLDKNAIRRRFGLLGQMPGKWREQERQALTAALALLSADELAAVKTVHFERRPSAPDKDPSRAALYEQTGCRATVFLFSSGVRANRFRFVGDVSSPRSAMLHSIAHEIGHAFEQSTGRDSFCKAKREKSYRKSDLIRRGNEHVRMSPVLAEYLRVLDGKPAPTDYGNHSKHESFAESFALFHVDPAALERARPAVYAWFKSGGHVDALP
jgi:hypothetical protein